MDEKGGKRNMNYEDLKNKYPELNWEEAEEVTDSDLEAAVVMFNRYIEERKTKK
jgi:ribosomal protein L16/L10AE